MGEAKRRKKLDANYGQPKPPYTIVVPLDLATIASLPGNYYKATITFDGQRFNVQWYDSKEEKHFFDLVVNSVMPKAREILSYFGNIKGIYGWEATVTDESLKILILSPAKVKDFHRLSKSNIIAT